MNSPRAFSINQNIDFLFINESSGELWLKEQKLISKNVTSIKNLKITSRNGNDASDDESSIEAIADIHFASYDNVRDFCEKAMCFYDSIELHAVEDFNGNFKAREIGETAPRLYRRICTKHQYHIEYKLLNGKGIYLFNFQFILLHFHILLTGTDICDIKRNKIFTKNTLDRERVSELQLNIECHIKMGSLFSYRERRVFNVTVLDVNDNAIKVQENHKVTNVKLDTPNFEKVNLRCFSCNFRNLIN